MAPPKTLSTMEKVLKFVGDFAKLLHEGLTGITKLKDIFKSFAWTVPLVMKVFQFIQRWRKPAQVPIIGTPATLAQYGVPTAAQLEEKIESKENVKEVILQKMGKLENLSEEEEIAMQLEKDVVKIVTDTTEEISTVPIDADDSAIPDVRVADCLQYVEPLNKDEDPEFVARLKFIENLRRGGEPTDEDKPEPMEVRNPTLNPREHCVMNASLNHKIAEARTRKMRGCRQGMIPMLRKSLVGECKWKFTPTDNVHLDLQVAKRLVMTKIAEYKIEPTLGSKLMKDLPIRIITPDQVELEALEHVTRGVGSSARSGYSQLISA